MSWNGSCTPKVRSAETKNTTTTVAYAPQGEPYRNRLAFEKQIVKQHCPKPKRNHRNSSGEVLQRNQGGCQRAGINLGGAS